MGNRGFLGFPYVGPPLSKPFANEIEMTPPRMAQFPIWRSGNGGTAQIEDLPDDRGMRITCYMPAGNSNSLTYAAVPCVIGSGGWQVTARFNQHMNYVVAGMHGIILRDSVGGDSVSYCWWSNSAFNRTYFTADDTYNSTIIATAGYYGQNDFWIRVKDDMTSWICYVSLDGDFWQQIYLEARNGSLGVPPTDVGIMRNPNYVAGAGPTLITGTPIAVDCYSWLYQIL